MRVGIADPEERKTLRAELYDEITKLYRQIRIAEQKMQHFRLITARGGRATPHSLADEIWVEMDPKPEPKDLLTFVPAASKGEYLTLPAGRAHIVNNHLFQADGVQIGVAQESIVPGIPASSVTK